MDAALALVAAFRHRGPSAILLVFGGKHGVVEMLTHWEPYALAGAIVIALSSEAGRSAPAIADPVPVSPLRSRPPATR